MEKALVAMSGGVDSAVAALLIKNSGYDAIGVTMRLSAVHNTPPWLSLAKECDTARMH